MNLLLALLLIVAIAYFAQDVYFIIHDDDSINTAIELVVSIWCIIGLSAGLTAHIIYNF